MTLSIKDSAEPTTPNKPAGAVRSPEDGPSQAPRANPVCLDVAVTIRSLQREDTGPTKQFREDCRTVIVFDNGAVVRCDTSLPAGQAVVLTNAQGLEAVCRVASGRNLPSIKGYIEVEFVEPVNDFWHLHNKDVRPVSVPPAMPVASTAPSTVASELLQSSADLSSQPGKAPTPTPPAGSPTGRAPSFEDVAGLMRTSQPPASRRRSDAVTPSTGSGVKENQAIEPVRAAKPTVPVAARQSGSAELITDVSTNPALGGAAPTGPRSAAPSSDFLAGSLFSSAPKRAPSSSGSSWTTWVLALIALGLAAYGAWIYLVQPNMAAFQDGKKTVASPPSAPERPPTRSVSASIGRPQTTPAPGKQTAPDLSDQTQPSTAATPGLATENPEGAGPVGERRQERTVKGSKQADLPVSSQPAIPNLKMKSPKAPNESLGNRAQQTASAPDLAPLDAAGEMPATGMLPAVARTPNQPAPPAPAFAPAVTAPAASATSASTTAPAVRTMQDAKLISSTRPVYPGAAKQSNVQGNVVVSAQIDSRGNVVDAKAVSGPMPLRQAAVDSVRKWKYSPAMVDGNPASSQVTVNVDFRLR